MIYINIYSLINLFYKADRKKSRFNDRESVAAEGIWRK